MRTLMIGAVVASTALVAVAATTPAGASQGPRAPHKAKFKVIAKGLNNPRQLNFSKSGKLYIAEAGAGGTSDCRTGAEGGPVCWGPSGSVTVVSHGKQHRVITGLPSYGDQNSGTTALGPADVVPYGKHRLAVSVGYGFAPKDRASLAAPGRLFGRLLGYNLKNGHRTTLGDLLRFEGRKNPIHDPNTDPTGIFKWGRTWYATDSGGNDLVRVRHHKVRLVKVFHDVKVPGGKAQAVPTDVVVGPDGALYVCELTGFPFVKGAASIYRIAPGHHRAKVYASGLTNVTSIAFGKDGKLYAVQIANKGLADPAGPVGSLWRVHSDKSGKKNRNLTGPLFAPYGVAIKGHNAYVSMNSVLPGAGSVIKVPLT